MHFITAQNEFLAKIKNVQLWHFIAFCDRRQTSLPRRILYNILDENQETVPAFLLAERFTGRAGVPPAQMEELKSSLVAGETPTPPVMRSPRCRALPCHPLRPDLPPLAAESATPKSLHPEMPTLFCGSGRERTGTGPAEPLKNGLSRLLWYHSRCGAFLFGTRQYTENRRGGAAFLSPTRAAIHLSFALPGERAWDPRGRPNRRNLVYYTPSVREADSPRKKAAFAETRKGGAE